MKTPTVDLVNLASNDLSVRLEVPAHLSAIVDDIDAVLPWVEARLAQFELLPMRRVHVRVHAEIASFVDATGQTDPALRAWARYGRIDLLPPSTWSKKTRRVLAERLTHETCHVAVYERLGDEATATQRRPPFFLDEGIASVVAAQSTARLPISTVIDECGGANPFDDRNDRNLNVAVRYGAAHHGLTRITTDFGPAALCAMVEHAARAKESKGAWDDALFVVAGFTRASLWEALRFAHVGD